MLRLKIPLFLLLCLFGMAGCGSKSGSPSASGDAPFSAFGKNSAPTGSARAGSVPLRAASAATSLAAGTIIGIELTDVVDSDMLGDNLFVMGTVGDPVTGPDGLVAIPESSIALLVIRDAERVGTHTRLQLALNRIQVGERTLKNRNGAKDLSLLTFDEDAAQGMGHRTVHLQRRAYLKFKLEAPLPLR